MNELDKIKKVLKQNKRLLQRTFKIKQLGLFGSYVRGDQKNNSDVDILVEFSETPGLFDFMKVENNLSNMLKRRVDLVMKGALKPTIGKNIMREVVYI
ncbi:MAG: nucleotidyltransferase family protein [Candidatus Omnitrophota bacterium]|nr:nucleotidyltransferase family protein [Candidatus Omnitrophota bacterium]